MFWYFQIIPQHSYITEETRKVRKVFTNCIKVLEEKQYRLRGQKKYYTYIYVFIYIIEPQNHRIAWARKDLTDDLVPTPPPWPALPPTRSNCQGSHPIWSWHIQKRGIHNSPGQPVPVPYHHLNKEFPLNFLIVRPSPLSYYYVYM